MWLPVLFLCCSFMHTGLARMPPRHARKPLVVRERMSAKHLQFAIQANPSLGSVVSVIDYGAKGDNVTDNTQAFQAAIAALGAEGGIVWVPAGNYLFKGTFEVPNYVTLQGTYDSPPAHNVGQHGLAPYDGSVLMPTAGRGQDENGTAFISIGANAGVRGFSFWYPDNVGDAAPEQYPYTLDIIGEDSIVENVELLNSYNGIRAVNCPRHYIARVTGQPVHRGIFIDQIYDIGRVENVHFNPWFSNDKTYLQHQLTFGVAFEVQREDWIYMEDCFVFGMSVGYLFSASQAGSCNGQFSGIGADMCPNASVLVQAADPWGLLIENGEFTSFINPQFGNSSADHSQIVVESTNKGAVNVVNSAFWGPSHTNARVQGTGSISFSSCVFNAWDPAKVGRASIEVGGSDVSVQGCTFQHPGAMQLKVTAPLKRGIFAGNMIEGAVNVTGVQQVQSYQQDLNAAA